MDTELQSFYRNKCVFVTGGSGFMGIVYIEKLLRATEVKRVYAFMRPKKGRTIDERLAAMLKNTLFDEVRKLKPDALGRITPICADCTLPDLGLSDEDRQMLIENVEVVLHSAASVRFDEPLYNAIAVNVRATIALLELAKKMLKLQAFVHVSSAFANCLVNPIDERFYAHKISTSAKQFCEAVELLGADLTNSLGSELRKPFPNSYTFTKALAEQAVLAQGASLPICVFRPSIVVPIYKEPVMGWLGNFYGPTTALYGAARGVLRVMYMKTEMDSHMVPVDYCANLMLATAWETAKSVNQCPATPPPIYNYVPDEKNRLTWGMYKKFLLGYGQQMPLSKMVWMPMLLTTGSKLFYKFLCIFYHMLPGYIFDFALMLMGKKQRMVKIYGKIHRQTAVLDYFVEQRWVVYMDNTKRLWKSLSRQDQQLFNFDMQSLDWSEYFYNSLLGMRLFLGKETPDTIPQAIKQLKRLKLLHHSLQFVLCCVLGLFLLWLYRLIAAVS